MALKTPSLVFSFVALPWLQPFCSFPISSTTSIITMNISTILFCLIATLLSNVSIAQNVTNESCAHLKNDTYGYLFQVCNYVVAENIQVTSHPSKWKIIRSEEKTIDKKKITLIYLSCCYTGDVAYFDKASYKLIKYEPGDK